MKTEKGLFISFIIGLLFRYILHLPGASLLIVISLSLLATLYFPAAFYFFCDKKIKKQNLPLSIISGLFLSIISIGILFKIQYWPGANFHLLIGTVTAPIILGVTYFLKKKASDELKTYFKNMTVRLVTLSILTILLYLTPTENLLKIQYREDPELVRLKTLLYANPYNEEYIKEHDEYIMKRDSLYFSEILNQEE